ncbi:hypothetical protein TRFO_25437 [Tritrichomonas foetus]|uniref:Uncharacterized protein n=1 Tax=Tritrichomonas foetus TaxID=1144522 RepID=A0A1J4K6M6_9EUKA|nr:hypothetical protein TRFO_25437 [Tritrichomonas foetus]|eukprot:OHT06544.1 hypothetical protein TRFO_25437 [Tritrichomonas foetus]
MSSESSSSSSSSDKKVSTEESKPNEKPNIEPVSEKPPESISLGKIRGVTIRKRVDPTSTNQREEYKIKRKVKHTLKGARVYFKFISNGKVLYSTKMKGKRPDGPLPIAKGDDFHYSNESFAGFLLSGNNHTDFSLRAQTKYGKEMLSIKMERPNGEKKLPKGIKVTFFLKDSLIPTKLVSLEPAFNDDGYFELNFRNKKVVASIKNCILINSENKCEFMMARKVDKNVVEADAVSVMSPLAVFAIVLALYETPF